MVMVTACNQNRSQGTVISTEELVRTLEKCVNFTNTWTNTRENSDQLMQLSKDWYYPYLGIVEPISHKLFTYT